MGTGESFATYCVALRHMGTRKALQPTVWSYGTWVRGKLCNLLCGRTAHGKALQPTVWPYGTWKSFATYCVALRHMGRGKLCNLLCGLTAHGYGESFATYCVALRHMGTGKALHVCLDPAKQPCNMREVKSDSKHTFHISMSLHVASMS